MPLNPLFRLLNTLWPIPTWSATLTCLLCVGVVVLLSVSGRLQVPPDLAHSARKMSVYLSIAKHNYNAKSYKNVIKLFVLTILKRPLRNLVEPLSSLTGPPTLTLPLFSHMG